MIVIARTLIRISKAERLGYDDYWIYLAYLILCINTVLQTLQTPYVYHLVRVRSGLEPAGGDFLENGNAYLRYEFTIIGLFWSTLWSVSAHLAQSTLNRTLCFEPQDMSHKEEADFDFQLNFTTWMLYLKAGMLTTRCVGEGELLGFLLEVV